MDAVWSIDGSITGHAGAHISFTLGPYVGEIDEAEVQAVLVGLGELLAAHGQFVVGADAHPAIFIGDRVLDRLIESGKKVDPDVAREHTEHVWEWFNERLRARIEHAREQPHVSL